MHLVSTALTSYVNHRLQSALTRCLILEEISQGRVQATTLGSVGDQRYTLQGFGKSSKRIY